jgi:hypothetical protein
MGETVFVKPKPGCSVQYPGSMTTMGEAGAEVAFDASRDGIYWRRRVNDGSLVIVEKTAAVEPQIQTEAVVESVTSKRGR